MTPDTLMLAALAGFAISVAALVALIWIASRDWLDDPVAEPSRGAGETGASA